MTYKHSYQRHILRQRTSHTHWLVSREIFDNPSRPKFKTNKFTIKSHFLWWNENIFSSNLWVIRELLTTFGCFFLGQLYNM